MERLTFPVVLAVAWLASGAVTPAGAEGPGGRPVWPVPGVLTRDFDPPRQDWLPGHRGVDVAARPGQPVVTPRAGVVDFVGKVAGTPVLVITHGTARATYQPVASELLPGTQVAAGQVIGTVSTGGHCTERCVHWGLILDEVYLDPRLLLGTARVVLIPVPD